MIDKYLESHRDILFQLFNLGGLTEIDLTNVHALELGDKSYCWICNKVKMSCGYEGGVY